MRDTVVDVMTVIGGTLFCFTVVMIVVLLSRKSSQPNISVRLSPIVRLMSNGETFCSGVVIRKDIILTAAHCVAETSPLGNKHVNTGSIEIRGEDNKPVNTFGRVVSLRPKTDQAIITGSFILFEPRNTVYSVEELVKLQQKGNKFVACGYPLGGDLFCQSVFFDNNNGFMWAVKGVLLPGMSGGPVFSDAGLVIAINDSVNGELSMISPTWNVDTMFPKNK
jgi:V8-like Glu-specific endopeptidase